jgi:inorganic pyrophosphatase
VHYPANYGFLPQTYCEDGDPLDVLVLMDNPAPGGCVLAIRPVGAVIGSRRRRSPRPEVSR